MQCEICNKKDAVVHFKHVADGELRELNICEDCAAKNGLSIQPPDLLTDFLMGKGKKPVKSAASSRPQRKCASCGITEADFSKLTRFGCADCYDVFESDVEDVAISVQKGNRHIGRHPKGLNSDEDIARLQGMLDEAVATQNFEEAARLRDLMNSFKMSGSEPAGKK